MGDESAKESLLANGAPTILVSAHSKNAASQAETCEPPESTATDAEPLTQTDADKQDDQPNKEQPAEGRRDQGKNRVQVLSENSPAGIMAVLNGDRTNALAAYINVHTAGAERSESLEIFTKISELQSSEHAYQSLKTSEIAAHSGALLTQRILLLSCHNGDIGLNVAKALVHETKIFISKKLVTLNKEGRGNYNFHHLVEQLAQPKKKAQSGLVLSSHVYVWAAYEISEDEVSNTILNSLLVDKARIDQYKDSLASHGLFIICVVPPQKLQEYKDSHPTEALQDWEIDFLRPLLEAYGLSNSEVLAKTIEQQRQEGHWSESSSDFYQEIVKYLKARILDDIVAKRQQTHPNYELVDVQRLLDRKDPIIDAVLYCATYFPNLSPQDFSYLVELYLGDAKEEVVKRTEHPQTESQSEPVNVVTSVPLVLRWRREADSIRRRCKLAAVRNAADKRVIDFEVDGLRSRLSQHIREEHYFFYESSFVLLRRRGLLFSPKGEIAEGARQLLVEIATEYPPSEVANWLYEIVAEFEEMADAADLLHQQSGLFQLLPDARVKAARRYVSRGLGLVLNRLNREPGLQEAARLFWLKVRQSQHQWFLVLLRQVGALAPTESLSWLKQLLDQGTKEIRDQVLDYLVAHLLRKDALIYETLKELMQWSKTTQAGRIAQELLIIYCVATNRQIAQHGYGQWPNSHPLFGFQTRAETADCLDLLTGWLSAAAYEVDCDNAPFIIADIFAGWYFILSSQSLDESIAAELETDEPLNAEAVRNLLVASLVKQCPRALKKNLLVIWEDVKNDILEEVFQLDSLANLFTGASLNAELINDAAIVRRKLLNTRALLSQLRKDLIYAAELTPG